MLKIWGRRNSQNVQKAMWLIGELELAHEHVDAGGKFGGLDTQEFRAMNPNGKVPVIKDGELVLWESLAILRYLAARYGRDNKAGRFWSDDAAQRAPADQWMDWSATSLQPAFINGIFMAYYRTPEALRNPQQVENGAQMVGGLMLMLDAQLAGKKYVLGDALSLADIPIACNLYRYFGIDVPKPKLPNVEAYYARLTERPAYRQHVMVSFADMKGVAVAR
ncbi:MAG: glutathione S-transferase [Rhodospirillales bacterium]